MPVLVTSNFDDDSIKNERASMETAVSHYKSMGNFLDAQGQLSGLFWLKFKLVRDFMHALVTCKYKKYRIKNNQENLMQPFPHPPQFDQLASETFKFESVDNWRTMDHWYTISSFCEPSAQVS